MKKNMSVLLLIALITAELYTGTCNAASNTDSEFKDPDGSFSYDSSVYKKYVAARYKAPIQEQYYLSALGIGKGDILGYVYLRTYWLVPYNKASDGNYYGIIAYECKIETCDVCNTAKRYISGMAQRARVGICTANSESRVCAPTAQMITANKTTAVTTSWTNALTFHVSYDGNQKKPVSASGTAAGSRSFSATNSISYESTSLSLIQKSALEIGNRSYAVWDYDYLAKKNKELDAYLYSDTYTAGQVEFRMDNNKSVTGKSICFYLDIELGAGYPKTGAIITNGWNNIRELGVLQSTVMMSY